MKERKSRVSARKAASKAGTSTRIAGVSRQVVSATAWRKARAALTAREKKHMRAMDAIAAARRRMPWMKIEKPYVFEGPDGRASLLDLFEGRPQLALYHFMFGPKVEGWPDKGCVGCSFVADQISHLDHIHARGITFAMVSAAPMAEILRLRTLTGVSGDAERVARRNVTFSPRTGTRVVVSAR